MFCNVIMATISSKTLNTTTGNPGVLIPILIGSFPTNKIPPKNLHPISKLFCNLNYQGCILIVQLAQGLLPVLKESPLPLLSPHSSPNLLQRVGGNPRTYLGALDCIHREDEVIVLLGSHCWKPTPFHLNKKVRDR